MYQYREGGGGGQDHRPARRGGGGGQDHRPARRGGGGAGPQEPAHVPVSNIFTKENYNS